MADEMDDRFEIDWLTFLAKSQGKGAPAAFIGPEGRLIARYFWQKGVLAVADRVGLTEGPA